MTALDSLCECIVGPLDDVRAMFDEQVRSDCDHVNRLCCHITQYRGKMLRPALVLLTGHACGRIVEQHVGLATVVELIHMTTLVHDDVLDESDLRRQVTTVNRMEGNETAVLLGDFLMSQAFCLCNDLNLPEASRLIGETTREICEGELMQIHNRGNVDLAEAQYFEIIGRKTASLLRLCCELGARYGGGDDTVVEAMRSYGYQLGLAFQIADDVLDIVGQQERTGKTLGRDLDKGKLTLSLIHFLTCADADSRREAIRVLSNGELQRREKLAGMLARSDSIDYALNLASQKIMAARECLSVLAPSPARDALSGVADFVITRQR